MRRALLKLYIRVACVRSFAFIYSYNSTVSLMTAILNINVTQHGDRQTLSDVFVESGVFENMRFSRNFLTLINIQVIYFKAKLWRGHPDSCLTLAILNFMVSHCRKCLIESDKLKNMLFTSEIFFCHAKRRYSSSPSKISR